MSPWNPLKKKSSVEKETTGVDPAEIKEPKDHDSFMQRGWVYHSQGEQDKAEADFRRAVSYSPESVDANYAMGLVMKSQGKNQESAEGYKN